MFLPFFFFFFLIKTYILILEESLPIKSQVQFVAHNRGLTFIRDKFVT